MRSTVYYPLLLRRSPPLVATAWFSFGTKYRCCVEFSYHSTYNTNHNCVAKLDQYALLRTATPTRLYRKYPITRLKGQRETPMYHQINNAQKAVWGKPFNFLMTTDISGYMEYVTGFGKTLCMGSARNSRNAHF